MKAEKKTIKPKKRILGVKKDALSTMGNNEFGAILEDIRGMFIALAEGQKILTERVDRVETKLDNFEIRIDNLETNMNSKFQTVFDYLSRIDDEIQDIKSRLEKLHTNKAETKEVNELAQRISHLEKELFEIRKDIREKVKQ